MTDSDVLRNQDWGDTDWRTLMQPALDTDLMGWVLEPNNLQKAWKRIKSNKGAPSVVT